MPPISWLDDAFDQARQNFLSGLKNPQQQDFSRFGTVEDVYKEVEHIQKVQSKTKSLVALRRIEPYIVGLQDYIGVMDTFSQLKPEIICLIWGPLKLILQSAYSLATAFKKLVSVLAEIGAMLPQFKRYAETRMFEKNDHVKSMMCLFYRDILDLHLEMLNFFKNKSLHIVIELLWPKFRIKLSVIQGNIENHKLVMNSNVTLEHVIQADRYRRAALQKFEEDKKFQNQMNFKTLSDIMSSPSCASKLHTSVEANFVGSGEWFFNDHAFQLWLNTEDPSQRCFWVQGIPGAGKTNLAASVIHRLKNEHNRVLYAFLSHDRQSFGTAVPLLHSLMFQATEAHSDITFSIWDAYVARGQDFTHNAHFVRELFCSIMAISGPLFIVVDGLDEIEDPNRGQLLHMLLEVLETCANIKLLLSSRPERDITRLLNGKTFSVKVDENNTKDIEEYVLRQGRDWTAELQVLGADQSDCDEIVDCLKGIVARAKGMFLYAKLVLGVARAQPDLESIQAELANLPEGLDQVYGRILSRIRDNEPAKRILRWIACAKAPLSESQVLQAILIRPSMTDFTKQRMAWLDIRAACGSIIEIQDGLVRFVHFTVHEYLFGKQSDNFLKVHDGHFEALSTCLTLFLFSPFDPIFSHDFSKEDEDDLRRRILLGDFILFRYAANFWLEHAKALSQNPRLEAQKLNFIHQLVARFYENRKDEGGTKYGLQKLSSFLGEFRYFKHAPKVQQSLAASLRFLDRLKYGHIALEDDDWISEDPTTLSLAVRHFESALERTITGCQDSLHPTDCSCLKVFKLYGTNLFKCKWKFCQFHFSGYSSVEARDAHEKMHQKPNRCPESNCPFAILGFKYEEDLWRHIDTVHPNRKYRNIDNGCETRAEMLQLPTTELLEMLEHTALNGDVRLARELVATIVEQGKEIDFNLLLQLAAWQGTDSMIAFLKTRAEHLGTQGATGPNARSISDILENALFIAIKTENLTTLRALLLGGAPPKGNGGIGHPDLRRFLCRKGIKISNKTKTKTSPVEAAFEMTNHKILEILVNEFGAEVMPYDFVPAIEHTRHDQAKLLERLPQLERFIPSPGAYSLGILTAVLHNHRTAFEICLEKGGDPNTDATAHRYKGSALEAAVGSNYRNPRPDFVKRLLQAGANPYPELKENSGSQQIVSIKDLPTMKTVEAYFGMGWDELVQKTQSGEDVPAVNQVMETGDVSGTRHNV